jgi:DNA-binding FrmR family transcriptional regulator
MKKHLSHPAIIKRLKRAEGHLHSITSMIENERECMDIAQQLHAVEKAISTAKKNLIHDHLEHCLDEGHPSKGTLEELKNLAKYL